MQSLLHILVKCFGKPRSNEWRKLVSIFKKRNDQNTLRWTFFWLSKVVLAENFVSVTELWVWSLVPLVLVLQIYFFPAKEVTLTCAHGCSLGSISSAIWEGLAMHINASLGHLLIRKQITLKNHDRMCAKLVCQISFLLTFREWLLKQEVAVLKQLKHIWQDGQVNSSSLKAEVIFDDQIAAFKQGQCWSLWAQSALLTEVSFLL